MNDQEQNLVNDAQKDSLAHFIASIAMKAVEITDDEYSTKTSGERKWRVFNNAYGEARKAIRSERK